MGKISEHVSREEEDSVIKSGVKSDTIQSEEIGETQQADEVGDKGLNKVELGKSEHIINPKQD